MGQALYRKYRSKSLAEIVGQEHITDTLQHALKSGRISHAYLFTGPRGVGKTSIARILAHEINGLPYDDSQTHIDIIEIDAASNRRIDEIRDLRDKVHVAPASAKYKVYIIDEVHMLTKEAFNALLKTLEEPPAHAVFILATTESHKLPATIVSRTQRFVFRPIAVDKATGHLAHIAKAEKISIDQAALELLAQHGDGSFRDSISLLDQAANIGADVTADVVRDLLSIPSDAATADLLQVLESGAAAKDILTMLQAQYLAGLQPVAVATSLAALLRQRVIDNSVVLAWATDLLAKLLEVPVAADPERYLEIVLLNALPAQPTQPLAPPTPTPAPVVAAPVEVETIAPTPKKSQPKPQPEPEVQTEPKKVAVTTTAADAKWPEVLAWLKKDYNTLYGIVRMAQPDFSEPGSVLLTFAFAFHEKRVKEAKNQQAIGSAIEAVYGQPLQINCAVDPDLKLATKSTPAAPLPDVPAKPAGDPSLSAISNIFGSAEVLE